MCYVESCAATLLFDRASPVECADGDVHNPSADGLRCDFRGNGGVGGDDSVFPSRRVIGTLDIGQQWGIWLIAYQERPTCKNGFFTSYA